MSGLGRHVFETFGGISWTRHLSPAGRQEIKREGVDVVVHCAFNSRRNVDSGSLYGYVADNVLLTGELVSVPHRKFVFLSSVDVYPNGPGPRSESTVAQIGAGNGLYGITKLMSEAIVRERCTDYLILRCVALLGRHMRKNSLLRIFEDEPCDMTLRGDSQLNYVLHADVSEFIGLAVENDLSGIYNVASSQNVSLARVADILGKEVAFGGYRYDVGDIFHRKVSSVFPAFGKTSEEEVVVRYIGQQATCRRQCS
jgi:nucleoside-diphosphate-sugar epimerase